ncbi:hypothetical protein [Halorubrum distributum]|uniref:Uncharacterized protein n=1 Tax=Halorubrum distributum JCM 10247 TaxID=1227486 RepID=M0CZG1_9EURY|nr:hypothetical protein [Halorubrum terrestre]ELZ27827.1 hypothetical protein C473_16504 [Halorubrum terrestre JCM 10247]
MYAEAPRGLETPVREHEQRFTTTPDALAVIVRADRAAHDVAQTSLAEFAGEIDLYPENDD